MTKRRTTSEDKKPTQRTAARLAPDMVIRPDAIAAKLSRPRLEVARTDAIRIALLTGLESMEREK
jgi:hypothetical protein